MAVLSGEDLARGFYRTIETSTARKARRISSSSQAGADIRNPCTETWTRVSERDLSNRNPLRGFMARETKHARLQRQLEAFEKLPQRPMHPGFLLAMNVM